LPIDQIRRNPPPAKGLSALAEPPPERRFARSSVIVLSCATFQQQFTFINISFHCGPRCVCHPESNRFYTRRLVGRFPVSCRFMSGEQAPAFFVSSLPAARGPASSHPGALMHLPPFHGHAGATVSTI
jgi:hypothetical protein